MIDKEYKHNLRGWIVKVLSVTLTHVYIRDIKTGYRHNVDHDYFNKYYEVI